MLYATLLMMVPCMHSKLGRGAVHGLVRPHMPVLNHPELTQSWYMNHHVATAESLYDVELPPQVRAQLSAVEGAMQNGARVAMAQCSPPHKC